jgi:isopenicillin-N N-acyltransferase-like protein
VLELPTLEISGSPRDLGRAHGRALAARIRSFVPMRLAAVRAWLAERHLGGPGRLVEIGASSLASLGRWHPAGLEEHLAVAEGAGVDPVELYLAANMTDLRDVLLPPGLPEREGCSLLLLPRALTRGGEIIAAQTWDLNPEDIDYVVALHRRPEEGPEAWTVTCTGCPALIGMNEHGLAVGTTNVKTRGARPGVGYTSMLARALHCRDLAEAADVIEGAPRAAAHVYWAADPGGALEWEALPDSVERRRLTNEPLVRTNHCLALRHRSLEADPPSSSSRHRLARLETLGRLGAHDADSLKAVFADRQGGVDAISRLPEDGLDTATDAVVIACPAERVLLACRGPAERGRWRCLPFGRRGPGPAARQGPGPPPSR